MLYLALGKKLSGVAAVSIVPFSDKHAATHAFRVSEVGNGCVSGDVSLHRVTTLKSKMFLLRDDSQKHMTWT